MVCLGMGIRRCVCDAAPRLGPEGRGGVQRAGAFAVRHIAFPLHGLARSQLAGRAACDAAGCRSFDGALPGAAAHFYLPGIDSRLVDVGARPAKAQPRRLVACTHDGFLDQSARRFPCVDRLSGTGGGRVRVGSHTRGARDAGPVLPGAAVRPAHSCLLARDTRQPLWMAVAPASCQLPELGLDPAGGRRVSITTLSFRKHVAVRDSSVRRADPGACILRSAPRGRGVADPLLGTFGIGLGAPRAALCHRLGAALCSSGQPSVVGVERRFQPQVAGRLAA